MQAGYEERGFRHIQLLESESRGLLWIRWCILIEDETFVIQCALKSINHYFKAITSRHPAYTIHDTSFVYALTFILFCVFSRCFILITFPVTVYPAEIPIIGLNVIAFRSFIIPVLGLDGPLYFFVPHRSILVPLLYTYHPYTSDAAMWYVANTAQCTLLTYKLMLHRSTCVASGIWFLIPSGPSNSALLERFVPRVRSSLDQSRAFSVVGPLHRMGPACVTHAVL